MSSNSKIVLIILNFAGKNSSDYTYANFLNILGIREGGRRSKPFTKYSFCTYVAI